MDQIADSFLILGLPPDASLKATKKAYRELVKKWHPDRFPNDPAKRQEAEEKIKNINLAFERIQEYREKYPFLSQIQSAKRPRPRPKAQPPKQPSKTTKTTPEEPSKDGPPKTSEPAAPSASESRPPAAPWFRKPIVIAAAGVIVLSSIAGIIVALRTPPREQPLPRSERVTQSAAPLPQLSITDQLNLASLPAVPASSANGSAELELARMLRAPSSESITTRMPERSMEKNVSSSEKITSPPALGEVTGEGLSAPFVKELMNRRRSEETPGSKKIDPQAEAEANYQLGLRHANGEGASRDFSEAAKWYRLAADAGHAEAQKRLGFLYATGQGVDRDQTEAEKWLNMAAAKGSVGANFASALLSLSKTNVAQTPMPTVAPRAANMPPKDPAPHTVIRTPLPTNTVPPVIASATNTLPVPSATKPPQLKRRSDLMPTNTTSR